MVSNKSSTLPKYVFSGVTLQCRVRVYLGKLSPKGDFHPMRRFDHRPVPFMSLFVVVVIVLFLVATVLRG